MKPQRKKNIEVYLGRFQPPHNMHAEIIRQMNNPHIIIIDGAKTREDIERNPLSTKTRVEVLSKFGTCHIYQNPYQALDELHKQYKITKLHQGGDRDYSGMLLSLNIDAEIVDHTRTNPISASEMREYAKYGMFEEFKSHFPIQDMALKVYMEVKNASV